MTNIGWMPARTDVSKRTLTNALRNAGGHVGLAARELGMSVKTLRRRLKDDPTIRPSVGIDEILSQSIIDAPSYRADVDYKHWDPDGVELEPRILTVEERNELIKKIRRAIAAEVAERSCSPDFSQKDGDHCDKG